MRKYCTKIAIFAKTDWKISHTQYGTDIHRGIYKIQIYGGKEKEERKRDGTYVYTYVLFLGLE